MMCYGKDFEGGRELSREIVDEKCADIDVFLRAVHDTSVITGKFTLLAAVVVLVENWWQASNALIR